MYHYLTNKLVVPLLIIRVPWCKEGWTKLSIPRAQQGRNACGSVQQRKVR